MTETWHVVKYASDGTVLARFETENLNERALQEWCDEQKGRKVVATAEGNFVTFEYKIPTWRNQEFDF